tara:strand:+ start:730 stop:924 length:195 start_codon:yes stop_codon:yes gene_type:complete
MIFEKLHGRCTNGVESIHPIAGTAACPVERFLDPWLCVPSAGSERAPYYTLPDNPKTTYLDMFN